MNRKNNEFDVNTFGDSKQYKCLVSLMGIINEIKQNDEKEALKIMAKISKFTNRMHRAYNSISHLPKKDRLYFNKLIKKDFIEDLGESWIRNGIPEKVYTHMLNYIKSYHKNINKTYLER